MANITKLRVAWEAAVAAYTEQCRIIVEYECSPKGRAQALLTLDALGKAETAAWDALRDAPGQGEVAPVGVGVPPG